MFIDGFLTQEPPKVVSKNQYGVPKSHAEGEGVSLFGPMDRFEVLSYERNKQNSQYPRMPMRSKMGCGGVFTVEQHYQVVS